MSLSNLSKMCRSCMETETESDMSQLFHNDLDKIFQKLTGLEISSNDGLPFLLCKKCLDELMTAEHFRERTIRTNITLLDCLHSQCIDEADENINLSPKETLHDAKLENNSHEDLSAIEHHVKLSTDVFVCYMCNQKYDNKKNLQKHKKTHSHYKCKACTKRCDTVQEIKEHSCTVTSPRENYNEILINIHYLRIFVCHICNQELNSSRALKHHFRTHTGERPCLCTECGLRFRCSSALLNHSRSVHLKEKRYKCSFCPKAFPVSCKKHEHERVHTGEKPYECEHCNKLFSARSSYNSHMRRHTKQIFYTCDVDGCKKGFYAFSAFQRHKWSHSGERPYPCDKCDKTYLSKQNLSAHHKAVHLKIKDQACHVCNKMFSERNGLNRHLRTIHKEQINAVK